MKTKLLIYATLTLILSLSFYNYKQQVDEMIAVKVKTDFFFYKLLDENGPIPDDNINYIFYYKNHVVATKTAFRQVRNIDTSYYALDTEYMIYEKGSKQGYLFENLKTDNYKNENVDSFLLHNNFNKLNVDSIFKNSRTISVLKTNNQTNLTQMSNVKNCYDFYDTLTLYFEKDYPKNIFALSDYEYGSEKMKLKRIHVKFDALNAQIPISQRIKDPYFDISLTLEGPDNSEEIKQFIKNFIAKHS